MWCRLAGASCWIRYCQQRGHAGPSVAALGANPASPLGGGRRSGGASQCTRRYCAPCGGCRGTLPVLRKMAVRALWRCMSPRLAGASRLAGGLGALVVFAAPAKLHNTALHEVAGQPVASSFVSVYRFAPCGFTQRDVMQNCLRWCGRQPSALPGQFLPYAPPTAALAAGGRCGLCQALRAVAFVSGLRPCILWVPRPPFEPCLLRGIGARSARPPPWGSLQCRAEGRVQGASRRCAPAKGAWPYGGVPGRHVVRGSQG